MQDCRGQGRRVETIETRADWVATDRRFNLWQRPTNERQSCSNYLEKPIGQSIPVIGGIRFVDHQAEIGGANKRNHLVWRDMPPEVNAGRCRMAAKPLSVGLIAASDECEMEARR